MVASLFSDLLHNDCIDVVYLFQCLFTESVYKLTLPVLPIFFIY